jgi:hypothetical protein
LKGFITAVINFIKINSKFEYIGYSFRTKKSADN